MSVQDKGLVAATIHEFRGQSRVCERSAPTARQRRSAGGTSVASAGSRSIVFIRARNGGWEASHRIRLPKQAEFEDYAALAYRDGWVAVISQASARLWVARIDEKARAVVRGSGSVYRFPSKSYGNIEGIAWLSSDTLVAVSDRKKARQPSRCAEKDQSIHLFRIPAGCGPSV
jgi:hypothetical protein